MLEKKIFDILKERARDKKLPSSMILIAQNPSGGIKEARELARQSFCLYNGDEGCQCLMCHHLNNLNHPDYFEIKATKNQITIDQIRELREEAQKPPFEARSRFFVLLKAHQLNISASNAFLKILEEPQEFAHFILLTSQPNLFLPTIRSRCFSFPVPMEQFSIELPENIVKAYEDFSLNPDILNLYLFIEQLSKEQFQQIPYYLMHLNFPSIPSFLIDIAFEYMDIIVRYPQTFSLKLLLEALFLPKWYNLFYKKSNL